MVSMKKIINLSIATAVFILPSTLVFGFNCFNPDWSAYRKCEAAELACATYCTGAAYTACIASCYAYPFPVVPC